MEAMAIQLVIQDITFWGAVGWPGIALYALALGVAGIHIYIAAEYTGNFRDMHVEGVWVYFLLASLFVMTVVVHIFKWKGDAKVAVMGRKSKGGGMFLMELWKKQTSAGPWYCWKVYFLEMAESINQIINTINIYTCTMRSWDRTWDMFGPIHGPRVSGMERLAAMVNCKAKDRHPRRHADGLVLPDLSNGIPLVCV